MSNNHHTDTYRWDTVQAIHVKDVNKIVRQSVASPPDFSYTDKDGWSAKGSFDIWQVVDGGDGKLLHFSLPIKKGVFTYHTKDIPFEKANAIIELELAFFDSEKPPLADQSGTFHDLKVKTTANEADDKVAAVLRIDYAKEPDSFLLKSLLPTAIEDWVNNNLKIFDHIFATVNLNKSIDKGKFAWVTPTAVDYAFVSNEDADKSILGVLCMTEKRPAKGLDPQVSPFAIPDKSQGGYLIANNRCLEKLIKPALPMVFKHLKQDDLELSADNNTLKLKNDKGITIPVKHKGKTYDCKINTLNVTIKETYVEIHYKCETDIILGITSHIESTHKYHIKVKTQSSGKQTLVFEKDGEPVVNKWTTQPTGVIITEIILGIIAAIAIFVLGIFTDGAAFILGALIIGLLMGAAIAAPNVVKLVGKDDAPDLSLLVANTTGPIDWAGQGKFKLDVAGLSGCLQLGGSYPD